MQAVLRGSILTPENDTTMTHTLRYEPISSDFYVRTRNRLASRLPAGSLVIVHANDVYPTNADGTLAHHQNANLFYLTGIDQEETVLLMRILEEGRHEVRESNPTSPPERLTMPGSTATFRSPDSNRSSTPSEDYR